MAKSKAWSAKRKNARIAELLGYLPEAARVIYKPLVLDIVLVEQRLEKVREKPFLEVNGRGERRISQAAKLYKMLQLEYISLAKTYESIKGAEVHEDVSPLRAFFDKEKNREED